MPLSAKPPQSEVVAPNEELEASGPFASKNVAFSRFEESDRWARRDENLPGELILPVRDRWADEPEELRPVMRPVAVRPAVVVRRMAGLPVRLTGRHGFRLEHRMAQMV